jgi:hypothetical protein
VDGHRDVPRTLKIENVADSVAENRCAKTCGAISVHAMLQVSGPVSLHADCGASGDLLFRLLGLHNHVVKSKVSDIAASVGS